VRRGLALVGSLWLVGCGLNPGSLESRVALAPSLTTPSYGLEGQDLYYPDWFEGTWQLTSTLTDLTAPLGVEYTNPTSFAKSQRERGQPLTYFVRFYRNDQGRMIADRVFNTIAAIQASQGQGSVLEVILDVNQPDRQLIRLSGNRRGELYITRRHSEHPTPTRFNSLEFYRQVLGSLNRIPVTKDVETTTLYRQINGDTLEATQLIAVFLVPTDERYFASTGRAVTIYRYALKLTRKSA